MYNNKKISQKKEMVYQSEQSQCERTLICQSSENWMVIKSSSLILWVPMMLQRCKMWNPPHPPVCLGWGGIAYQSIAAPISVSSSFIWFLCKRTFFFPPQNKDTQSVARNWQVFWSTVKLWSEISKDVNDIKMHFTVFTPKRIKNKLRKDGES